MIVFGKIAHMDIAKLTLAAASRLLRAGKVSAIEITDFFLARIAQYDPQMNAFIRVAAEQARLAKDLEKVEAEIVKAEQKLNNPAFVQKVPPPVLQEHKKRLADWQSKRAHLRKALEDLGRS